MVKILALGPVTAPGAIRVEGPEEARREALRLAEMGEKVVIAGEGAWRLYHSIAQEMRMNTKNFYLLEALDPIEAELAGTSWGKLLLSRVAYTARRPAEKAFSELGSVEKKVTRRALLRGTIVEAAMEYTEKPVEDATLCRNPAIEEYCEHCLRACSVEGGCPVSAALCGIELLYLPGYTRSGLHDALRSIAPVESDGYAVIAPRSAIADIIDLVKDKTSHPVVMVPVSCPYGVGLEELLALHAVGLQPLVVEAGWEPGIKRCRESRSVYRDMVESDYVKVTGLRLLHGLEELAGIVREEPRVIRVRGAQEYLARGLRPLALAVLRELGISADLSTGFSAVPRIDAEKCTICGACAYECPTNALKVKEAASSSVLLFLHDRCIACGYCEKVCPENALSLSPSVNASLINTWAPLVLKESLRCIVCGAPLGSASMIEKVLEKLIRKGLHPEKMPQLLMCETCRQKYSLGMISDEQVDYEALYLVVNRVRRRLGLPPLEPPGKKPGSLGER